MGILRAFFDRKETRPTSDASSNGCEEPVAKVRISESMGLSGHIMFGTAPSPPKSGWLFSMRGDRAAVLQTCC